MSCAIWNLPALVFLCAALAFGWRRLLSYLRYFQQEEYNDVRFRAWLRERRAWDTRGTAVSVITAVLAFVLSGPWLSLLVALVCGGALLGIGFIIEGDPRTSGKLKLNMTQRATKIFEVAFAMLALTVVAIEIGICLIGVSPGTALGIAALSSAALAYTPPLLLALSNRLLWPAEKRLQDSFRTDAQKRMKTVKPFVIAITGSYGKTGAKAALGELLTQTLGPTFWPKKSINTVMGITRDIRENLRSLHKFAVLEMGAYGIGSIKKLCDFVAPDAALVTAVGIMHLERFGSPENIYIAKSELAQALPLAGILVCNGDNPGARRMAREHDKKTTLLYGLDPSSGHLDCLAKDIAFDERGTSFTVQWKGESYKGRTPLLGRPALSNALGAFTMACALGAEPAYSVACMANLDPVDNRLVLDRKGSIGFLRDAYNSNPTGFAAALEVLAAMPAKRRILMTPGMIELGELQYDENRQVAKEAAAVCDLVIVVSSVNRQAVLEGLRAASFAEEKIVVVDTRDEGFKRLAQAQQPGDLVLLENDLGDLHEGRVKF